MKTTDRLTPELRKIEKEIDDYYKSNPLVNLPFATSAWYLLATAQDTMLTQLLTQMQVIGGGIHNWTFISDNTVNKLNHPLRWLYRVCGQNGRVPDTYNRSFFEASHGLFNVGQEYTSFVLAFTFAYRGWIELELQKSTIRPKGDLFADIEYNVYDVLMKSRQAQEAFFSVNFNDLPMNAIRHSIRIKGERFSCKLNPKIVADTITARKPQLDAMFSLPSEWQFSRYTLGEFRKVFEAISAMADIYAFAHAIAAVQGCSHRGYSDSIYTPTCSELLRRVARYSGVSEPNIRSIIDDLSYGNRNISDPDPALQPLIKLNSEVYAIMPYLWVSCSAERNLTVLINKLPSEKGIYAKLKCEKEALMRRRFTTGLSAKDSRFVHGSVPGVSDLPDVDLAIIKDSEKACLLLELKWFIEPAEVRETIQKSEEIEKGISQLLKLKCAFADNCAPLLEKLKVDSSYRLDGVVVSANSIGHAKVQSSEIPVIQADHLIAKLKDAESLESVVEWLTARKYLPKEGTHFQVHKSTSTISNWHLEWYEIEPLISDPFFPL